MAVRGPGRLPVLVAVLTLAGCASPFAAIDDSVADPVWLTDGWIYYQHQSASSAPFEVC